MPLIWVGLHSEQRTFTTDHKAGNGGDVKLWN
jgi:hypothetical protein